MTGAKWNVRSVILPFRYLTSGSRRFARGVGCSSTAREGYSVEEAYLIGFLICVAFAAVTYLMWDDDDRNWKL